MVTTRYRSAIKRFVTLLGIAALAALFVQTAAALDGPKPDQPAAAASRGDSSGPRDEVKPAGFQACGVVEQGVDVGAAGGGRGQDASTGAEVRPRIAASTRVVSGTPAPAVPAAAILATSFKGLRLDLAAGAGEVNSNAGPSAGVQPPASTAPMTPDEKFKLFLTKSFVPPGPYALSVVSGLFGEALDTKDKKHRSDAGEFLADSMTRAARSFAFRATANFFEKFAYASIFKQDPRYHRSNKSGAGARIGYAISRLFVTQGDRSGSQFNVSFIMGGVTATAISNAWERDERRNARDAAKRFGIHLGLTAFTNIVREFIGGQ